MTTSLLYHAFAIRGYTYQRTVYREGAVIFTVEPRSLRCAVCRSWNVVRRGQRLRTWRSLPVANRPTFVEMGVPRLQCHDCGAVRQMAVDFADPLRSFTRAFQRFALELCSAMTMLDAARFLRVGWHLIKDILKRDLQHRFAKPKLGRLRRIAIDEIAVRKGHRYLTVVADLDTGAVVFVGNGRGTESLTPFFQRLRRSRARVQAVAMDFSAAYQRAVRTSLPQAVIVFDRFHVVKLFNDRLSDLRRDLFREADVLQRKVLKGVRWLLLKREDNLNDRRNERQRLRNALALNEPLATAYYMKEELALLWQQEDLAAAEEFLDDWLDRAHASCIGMLQRMGRTLATHRNGLLAWYQHPISTGPLEGINNKIKTLKRQAYGYRDQEFFKLRILSLHEKRYALVG